MAIPEPLLKLIRSLNGMEHAFLKVETIEERVAGEEFLLKTKPSGRDSRPHVFYELRFDPELSLLCAGYATHPCLDEHSAEEAQRVLDAYQESGEHLFFVTEEDPPVLLAVYVWEVDEHGKLDCEDDPRTEILQRLAALITAWNEAFDFICRTIGSPISGTKTFVH